MSYTAQSPNYQLFPVNTFSGDGVTTTFTLTFNVLGESSLLVWQNGLKLPTSKYAVNGTQLTIFIAPPVGTGNIEVFYLNAPDTSAAIGTGVTSVGLATTLVGLSVGGQNPVTSTGTMSLTGNLAVASGGTGATTFPANQVLVGSGTSPIGVSANTGAAGQALLSTGGLTPPAFGNVVLSLSTGTTGLSTTTPTPNNVVLGGVLNVTNGGTGQPAFTANQLLIGNSATSLNSFANGPAGSVLMSQGASAIPTWSSSFARTDDTFGVGAIMFGSFPTGTNASAGQVVSNILFNVYGVGTAPITPITGSFLLLGSINTTEETFVLRTA